ncbi:hypothetical protein KDL01_21390 [Actinospica durhamensis]|uniref:Uncharacterized protein n=1 Tax=Actinospica durhamensis TaxID=1508375 RepID=A0A941IRZ4_9ACTN|nr:hypothetical protein [Actinospica durhamensis]MBR7835842.1 hypothetical protein [Actinospica durhamensis]
MDRLAVHVIATAALTVTLATVPALFAVPCHASSAAAAAETAATATVRTANRAPSALSDAVVLPDAVAVLPALSGRAQTPAAEAAAAHPAEPAPASPRPAPTRPGSEYGRRLFPSQPDRRCADVRQVGHTVYARYRGMIAFSVRQYYSAECRTYYGYSYAWHRFRRLHVPFDVGMAVYNTHTDAIDGAVAYIGGRGGPGYWSAVVAAQPGQCTCGEGHYFYYPADAPGGFIEGDTLTAPVCAAAAEPGPTTRAVRS